MSLGMVFYSWLRGELIGKDEFGNTYFRSNSIKRYGREKRWVLYDGVKDASKIPAEWHSWLHHTSDEPLSVNAIKSESWQKSHKFNQTGKPGAYRPKGHDYNGGVHAPSRSDYESWKPK